MVPAALGHYRILGAIGSGGMGEVYLAEDTRLGRRVALKVLAPDLAHDPERQARFEREARSIAVLNHPNIVTIYSVGQQDDILFMTMELVEGYPLDGTAPTQITPFVADGVMNYAWSRDERTLALLRGSDTSDLVLVTAKKD